MVLPQEAVLDFWSSPSLRDKHRGMISLRESRERRMIVKGAWFPSLRNQARASGECGEGLGEDWEGYGLQCVLDRRGRG